MTSEESIEKKNIQAVWHKDFPYYKRLLELYELDSCCKWILDNKFSKVCVQFPDSLLIDSVDIAAYIEIIIGKKVFILGDTAYGSCCVDELGAQHVFGDCVIHFGHACLSPVTIPTYYVFLKRPLDINKFFNIVARHTDLRTPVIVLFDVSYSHLSSKLRKAVNNYPSLKKILCISELVLDQNLKCEKCSQWCFLQSAEYSKHCTTTLQRAYCPHPSGLYKSLVYIGAANANLFNFTYVFKDCKIYNYTNNMDELQPVCKACITKKISYMVEKIRSAHNIGIIVATLGIQGYKDAIFHAKYLCSLNDKRSYILSIGKPTPAKIANFSEMDIFVAISCPESDFGDEKNYMQPIVGLYELDLALNRSRHWAFGLTRDFRDVIKGVNQLGSAGRITTSKGTSYDSLVSSSWSLISISTTSIPRLATAASMRLRELESSMSSLEKYETYNVNDLMAQMNASRNAQSLVHQMKRLSTEDLARMKAYQITVQKPESEAFQKQYYTDRKKQEFWAAHKNKQRTTMIIDSFPRPENKRANLRDKPSVTSYDYQQREIMIKNKLKEIENLGQELNELLEKRSNFSFGGRSYVEPKDRKDVEEVVDDHALQHIIPRSVLDQLTQRPSTSHTKEWKGLDQKLGEDPPAVLKEGRKGGPQTSYDSEPKK